MKISFYGSESHVYARIEVDGANVVHRPATDAEKRKHKAEFDSFLASLAPKPAPKAEAPKPKKKFLGVL